MQYFDALFEKRRQGDPAAQEAFGEYVHWGYWDNPSTKILTAKEYHEAGAAMTEQVVAKANIQDGQAVLDIGSGLGGTIKMLNGKHSACEFVGVNIDPRQIEVAQKEVTSTDGNTISFIEADACKLPFTKPRFDAVLCVESIFHFDSRRAFFEEAERVLKPGGKLVVSDFVPIEHIGAFLNQLQKSLHLVDVVYGPLNIDVSVSEYKKLAKSHGFSIDSVDDISEHTFPTYAFLKKNFTSHLPEKKGEFNRATSFIEYASKLGFLKYMILTFTKNV